MIYRCIKEFYLVNFNSEKSAIEENVGFVGLDTLWEIGNSEYIVNKSHVKLHRIDDGEPFMWIEINKNTLSNNFKVEEV